MAANTVTYFGDVTTVGNTVVAQTLTSQGNYSIFTGNVSPAVTSNVGSVAIPWNAAYLASANVTSSNISSISRAVGVNTASDNSTKLLVDGNVYASSSLESQNVFATTSANLLTLNTSSISGFLGINTTSPSASQTPVGGGTITGSAVVIPDAPRSNVAIYIPNSTSGVDMGTQGFGNTDTSTRSLFFEAWIYIVTISGRIATVGTPSTTGWQLQVANITGRLEVLVGGTGTGWPKTASPTTAVVAGTWTHVAGAFTSGASGSVCAWVNGGSKATTTWSTGNAPGYSSSDNAWLGVTSAGGLGTGFYIRDLRIFYGTGAPANPTTFTPDSAPFSATCPTYAFASGTLAFRLQPLLSIFPYNLKVEGNVQVSNSFQMSKGVFTNVLVTTSNIGQTATKRIFSPLAGGVVGIGQFPVVGSATLQVTGNVFASNALQSAKIFATSSNSAVSNILYINGNIGINKSSTDTTVDVAGNVYISRYAHVLSFVIPNSNLVTILGVSSIYGPVGINTNADINSNLTILGNVWASNALYGNIIGPLANVTTLNVSFIYGTAGSVGFNTSVTPGGPTFQFSGGNNVYASNALSAQNIAVTTSMYYNEDLTKRSPHLVPNTSNAGAIQAWINASCNTTQKVGWSASAAPVYSNIVTGGPQSSGDYSSSILLADGRVLFVPYNASNIGVFNPANSQLSIVVPSGTLGGPFSSGILLPTGNALFFSTSGTVGTYNPITFDFSSISIPGGAGSSTGVLTANNILVAPNYWPSNVVNYNFNTGVMNPVKTIVNKWREQSTSLYSVNASGFWESVTWSPVLNIFVASGLSIFAWSIDGKDWNNATTIPPGYVEWYATAWSDSLNIFVAVGGAGGLMNNSAWSTDGKNWYTSTTLRTVDPFCYWHSVAWSPTASGGLFVAGGGGGSFKSAWSINGKDWNPATTSLYALDNSCYWDCVEWSPVLNIFVAAGTNGTFNSAYSANGKDWYLQQGTTLGNIDPLSSWSSVAWSPTASGGLFVAVGYSGSSNSAYTSDGVNWSLNDAWATGGPTLNNLDPSCVWLGIAWSPNTAQSGQAANAGIFVAVGGNGTFNSAWSEDGVNWYVPIISLNTIDPLCSWYSVRWSPALKVFVATGGAGGEPAVNSAWSEDGKRWYNIKTLYNVDSSGTQWRSIAWSDFLSMYVAVAYAGSLNSAWSRDGLNWLESNSPICNVDGTEVAWSGVAWSPDLNIFVAVGGCYFAYPPTTLHNSAWSIDGVNWNASIITLKSVDPDCRWYCVTWSPTVAVPGSSGSYGIFVAVGGGSGTKNSAWSSDGKNWYGGATTPINNIDPGAGWRVAWSPALNIFVAVENEYGANGSGSAWSSDGLNWNASTTPLGPLAYFWMDVAWSPTAGIFSAVGYGDSGYSSAWSTDGKNWYAQTTNNLASISGGIWTAVACNSDGVFMAICDSSLSALSTDGKNWFRGPDMSSTNAFIGLAAAGQGWAACGTGPGGFGGAFPGSNSTFAKPPSQYQNGTCLLPNGNVIIPSPGTANVMQFDPVSLGYSNIYIGTEGFSSLTLAPNGNVVGTPVTSNIIVVNPSSGVSSNITTGAALSSGVLLPTSNIIFTSQTSNGGMFDPSTLQYSNATQITGSFSSAKLIPKGQVVFTPYNSANVGLLYTMTPVSREFCMSPYFNKF